MVMNGSFSKCVNQVLEIVVEFDDVLIIGVFFLIQLLYSL